MNKKGLIIAVISICIVIVGVGITTKGVTGATSVIGEATPGPVTVAVDFNGKVTGYFAEVKNIGTETQVTEHNVIGPTGVSVVQKIPGRSSVNEITITRPITTNPDLWDWREEVSLGNIESARVNGTISVYAVDSSLIAEWSLENVWPSKIKQVIRESDGVLLEEVTIICEQLSRTQ